MQHYEHWKEALKWYLSLGLGVYRFHDHEN
jgi:hypothetical protein